LAAIAAACPALRDLSITGSLELSDYSDQSATDLQPLTALAGSLSQLEFSAQHNLQDAHLQTLAALHGLSSLKVESVGAYISDRGLLTLTALSKLTYLELGGVESDAVSEEVVPKVERRQDINGTESLHERRLVLYTQPDQVREHLSSYEFGVLPVQQKLIYTSNALSIHSCTPAPAHRQQCYSC
jgi:hypothetical protein